MESIKPSVKRRAAPRRNNVDLLSILGYPVIGERDASLHPTPRFLCAGSRAMIDLKRRRLVRNLLLVAVLMATATVLTACEVSFYELGRVAGEIAREIADWLKEFFKGFASGFGGPCCSTPTSLLIIGLAVVWRVGRRA
jgi:hypothetical protein